MILTGCSLAFQETDGAAQMDGGMMPVLMQVRKTLLVEELGLALTSLLRLVSSRNEMRRATNLSCITEHRISSY